MGAPDPRGLEIVGVEVDGPERRKLRLLLVLVDEARHLAGLLVLAVVGERVAPHHALHAQVVEVREAPTVEESRSHEADPALHEGLVRGPTRPRRERREAMCAGVVHEAAVEDRFAAGPPRDDRLLVVEDVDRRPAAEEGQASIHAAEEGSHLLR